MFGPNFHYADQVENYSRDEPELKYGNRGKTANEKRERMSGD
jgi:hypothetical protein